MGPCFDTLIVLLILTNNVISREQIKDPFIDDHHRIWENWDPTPVPFPHLTQKKKEQMTFWPQRGALPPLEVPDPNHQGLLKDIGSINVGFGVGVGVPGNDPVSVGTRVGVGLGESGLAGGVPIGEDIFPRRGEIRSLNDYDGNKQLILPDKATKYLQAIQDGKIRLIKHQQPKSLVGVQGGIGIGK